MSAKPSDTGNVDQAEGSRNPPTGARTLHRPDRKIPPKVRARVPDCPSQPCKRQARHARRRDRGLPELASPRGAERTSHRLRISRAAVQPRRDHQRTSEIRLEHRTDQDDVSGTFCQPRPRRMKQDMTDNPTERSSLMNTTPFQKACDELKAIGLILQQAPGQYRVNYRKGSDATEYTTDDLQAAVIRGREMAAQPPAPREPPLGPTGPRSRRRAFMYRHNIKLAARRARKSAHGKT
jgi:hypothetical protein